VSPHAQHEELLQRILVGELSEGAPEARRQLRDCPECRAELERLRALDARLAAVVEQEHGDLGQARAESTPADREHVRLALLGPRAAPRRARRAPRWELFALAAGLLLLFGWAANSFLPSPKRAPEVLLDTGTIPGGVTLDESGDYGEFWWRYDLKPQDYFELELRAVDADGLAGEIVQKVPPQREPRWTPSPEEKRVLPDRLSVKVLAKNGTRGRILESGSFPASRR